MREFSLLIPVAFTGGVSTLYLSLPYVQEATKKLQEVEAVAKLNKRVKEATDKTALVVTNIGADIGIIELPVQKSGPVNPSNLAYQNQLEDDMKNFLADIDGDRAEFVELQEVGTRGSESERLL